MREIELKEMQQIELQLLFELDRVCKEKGLRYYIDGGTLLGAVCYDGFIPWDDDIDVKMPRPDYELLRTMQGEFPEHILLDAPRKEHCEFVFLKLTDSRTVLEEPKEYGVKTTGVYIDILPMDGHPEGTEICERHIARLRRYNGLFHNSLSNFSGMIKSGSIVNRMKGLLYRTIYTPWRLYRLLTKTAEKYPYDGAKRVGLLIEGDPIRERFEKEWLEPPMMLEFEGRRFPAPNEPEKHLSIFYRKPISRELYYKNLPYIPSSHTHRVYWKEDPCRD
ncbi:MAG: LicD family protein [Clostridiales bacterium]|nr:LicD family protein [Clostridiales bacterium]